MKYKLMLYAGQNGIVTMCFQQVHPDDTRDQLTIMEGPWETVIAFLGEAPFTLGMVHVKVSA